MQMERQLTLVQDLKKKMSTSAVLSRTLQWTHNPASDAFEYSITLTLPEVAVPFDLSGSSRGN